MAKQVINLGTTINDGTGDTLRLGAEKINENFTELYDALSTNNAISVVSSVVVGPGLIASNPSGPVTISVTPATQNTLGSVKIGSGLSINETGVLSAPTYTLPKAASNILGGIKVGDNLTINSEGVLSAVSQNYTLPTASGSTLGGVKVGSGLNIVNGVLNVLNSESAAVLVNGDSIVSLEVESNVNILRSNLTATLQTQGSDSTSLEWVDDIEDIGSVTRISATSSGATIVVGQVGSEKTFTFNSSGILEFDNNILIDSSDNNFEVRGANNFNVEAQNVVNIYTDAQGNAHQWQFGDDGILSTPAGIKIYGDTTAQQAEYDALVITNNQKLSEINSLEGQLADAQDQLSYYQGVAASSTPGSPPYIQAVSQISYWQGQVSSLQSAVLIAQSEASGIQSQLAQQQLLLSQANVILTYNVADEALEFDHGFLKFPDGTIQTTAYLGESLPEIEVDSLDNGSYSVNLNANGSLTIPGIINSTSIFTIEAVTDINATAGEDVVLTAGVGFALRNYSTTDGISIITAFNDETESVWEFKTNGNLQLPAGGAIVDSNGNPLVQEGFKVVTAPTTSKGYAGNILGDVAFTSGNFYYCTGTYDGTTDIWVKTAWTTTGTWTEEGEGGGIQ